MTSEREDPRASAQGDPRYHGLPRSAGSDRPAVAPRRRRRAGPLRARTPRARPGRMAEKAAAPRRRAHLGADRARTARMTPCAVVLRSIRRETLSILRGTDSRRGREVPVLQRVARPEPAAEHGGRTSAWWAGCCATERARTNGRRARRVGPSVDASRRSLAELRDSSGAQRDDRGTGRPSRRSDGSAHRRPPRTHERRWLGPPTRDQRGRYIARMGPTSLVGRRPRG